jgi:hypothetical protein
VIRFNMKILSLFHPVCLWHSGIVFVFMGNAKKPKMCPSGLFLRLGSPNKIIPENVEPALSYNKEAVLST